MAEPYNLSILTSRNDIVGTVQGVNELAGGWFITLFLILFAIILFVLFKNYEFKRALSGSMFITTLVAMLFRIMALINDTILFSFFLITAISFLWMMWGD